jgi:hypothetical protein
MSKLTIRRLVGVGSNNSARSNEVNERDLQERECEEQKRRFSAEQAALAAAAAKAVSSF